MRYPSFEDREAAKAAAAARRGKMCPCCQEEGTITCTGCEAIKYCSLTCQSSDLAAHGGLCKTYKDFENPPQDASEVMVRAIFFPVDGDGPKWVWVPKRLCNEKSQEELKAYLGKGKGDKLGLDKALEVFRDDITRKNTNRIDILMNHGYNFDDSAINKSVIAFTAGRICFGWSADILVYPGGLSTWTSYSSNIEMKDVA